MRSKAAIIRYTILLGIVFCALNAQAQLWAGLGYHASVPVGVKNLNYVVDRYNAAPGKTQSKDMKQFNYMDGVSFRFGMWHKSSFLDIGYSGAGQRRYAIGTETGKTEKQTDLKATFNAVEICGGKVIRNEEFNSIGVGLIAGIGSIRVRTRTDDVSKIKNAYYRDAIKQAMFTLGLCGRVMVSDPGITLEPFARFSFFASGRANAADVNQMINEKTYLSDSQKLNFNGSTIGINIYLSITTKK